MIYKMHPVIWRKLDKIYDPDNVYSQKYVDECIFEEYGLQECENHRYPDTAYDYTITDKKKFTMFALRWGYDT